MPADVLTLDRNVVAGSDVGDQPDEGAQRGIGEPAAWGVDETLVLTSDAPQSLFGTPGA
ncbi:hypothetical protein [Streptomyces sp. NPDC057696]|uniref:hypothetical protein n=1 Tax=Streptomyces sp. NPDC057696 TaxID=3346218 RepID=UPI0036B4BD3A